MCLVRKHNLELKRKFVTNHCVATLKESDMVDMCLFSGEGRPALLGGYVISPKEAFDLGRGLLNTSGFLKKSTEKDKRQIINESVVTAYKILLELNPEQAEQLRALFDIKIVEKEELKEAHGYIG